MYKAYLNKEMKSELFNQEKDKEAFKIVIIYNAYHILFSSFQN